MKIDIINISPFDNPKYETPLSAGLDVRADFSRVLEKPVKIYGEGSVIIPGDNPIIGRRLELAPGSRALIPTGLFTAIPEGYEIQVRPRSGLALKEGLTCANCVGTIDADYRAEIGVIIINLSNDIAYIDHGQRIAQLVLNKVERVEWNKVESLDETDRHGGFGSTGTH